MGVQLIIRERGHTEEPPSHRGLGAEEIVSALNSKDVPCSLLNLAQALAKLEGKVLFEPAAPMFHLLIFGNVSLKTVVLLIGEISYPLETVLLLIGEFSLSLETVLFLIG